MPDPPRRYRVAIGPSEIAGCSGALADGLRANGSDAEVTLAFRSPHYDGGRVLGRSGRVLYAAVAPFRRDVFDYQYASTWVPYFVDAYWARLLGRTLVAHCHGDDCRLYGVAQRLFPARGRVGSPAGDAHTRKRLHLLGRACHAALVADLELATYVEPYFRRVYVTPLPLRPEPEPDRPPRRSDGPLVVLHAPSDPKIKGTEVIRSAVESVAAQVPLEFRLLTGVDHGRVTDELQRADIVVDQLNSVTSGIFALEAMRAGLPVIGELDPSALPPYQRELPVVPATPDSLPVVLASLALDPERRASLGTLGRAYVARRHNPAVVASTVLEIFEHARRSPRGVFEATSDGITALAIPWRGMRGETVALE